MRKRLPSALMRLVSAASILLAGCSGPSSPFSDDPSEALEPPATLDLGAAVADPRGDEQPSAGVPLPERSATDIVAVGPIRETATHLLVPLAIASMEGWDSPTLSARFDYLVSLEQGGRTVELRAWAIVGSLAALRLSPSAPFEIPASICVRDGSDGSCGHGVHAWAVPEDSSIRFVVPKASTAFDAAQPVRGPCARALASGNPSAGGMVLAADDTPPSCTAVESVLTSPWSDWAIEALQSPAPLLPAVSMDGRRIIHLEQALDSQAIAFKVSNPSGVPTDVEVYAWSDGPLRVAAGRLAPGGGLNVSVRVDLQEASLADTMDLTVESPEGRLAALGVVWAPGRSFADDGTVFLHAASRYRDLPCTATCALEAVTWMNSLAEDPRATLDDAGYEGSTYGVPAVGYAWSGSFLAEAPASAGLSIEEQTARVVLRFSSRSPSLGEATVFLDAWEPDPACGCVASNRLAEAHVPYQLLPGTNEIVLPFDLAGHVEENGRLLVSIGLQDPAIGTLESAGGIRLHGGRVEMTLAPGLPP